MDSRAHVERSATEQTGDADDGADASLSKDDAYHLLQNGRRRAVLRHLLDRDGDVFEMRDVAEAVAAWEHDTTVRQLSSDQRQRVYIALYQSHLPKLDDHDVVDYDQDRGRLMVRPLLHALEPYLGDGLDAPQTLRAAEAGEPPVETGGLLSRFSLASR